MAYFARQWALYGSTPVEVVGFAESGTSARAWVDDPADGVECRLGGADPEQPAFHAVLEQYFGGIDDDATTARL